MCHSFSQCCKVRCNFALYEENRWLEWCNIIHHEYWSPNTTTFSKIIATVVMLRKFYLCSTYISWQVGKMSQAEVCHFTIIWSVMNVINDISNLGSRNVRKKKRRLCPYIMYSSDAGHLSVDIALIKTHPLRIGGHTDFTPWLPTSRTT